MFSVADCLILPVVHFITKYLFFLSASMSQPTATSVEADEQEEDDEDDEDGDDNDGESGDSENGTEDS